MKKIRHSKLLATTFYLVMLLLCACKGKNQEQPEALVSDVTNEHAHSDSLSGGNEVKAEAPDAESKTEQGYAFPRQSPQLAQSPINIISAKAERDAKHQFAFSFHSAFDTTENLGHTIQVDFKKGSSCTVNAMDYLSKQFHFHTPSEHLIDGMTYPLEMHIVNVLNDSNHAGRPSYLVLGVFFKMGKENKFLKEFLDRIPDEDGKKNALHSGEVKLDDLFSQFAPDEIKSYYAYNGSLTTSPFTEAVQWVILKHVPEASEEQVMKIEKMEGNNARHVQAVNNRIIYNQ